MHSYLVILLSALRIVTSEADLVSALSNSRLNQDRISPTQYHRAQNSELLHDTNGPHVSGKWFHAPETPRNFEGITPSSAISSYGESQNVLAAELQSGQHVPSPPLEIEPLIVSGSESNRVDLVFFSDGCASHSISHNSKF